MDIVDLILVERLKSYEEQTGERKKAILLHSYTLQFGASLLSMIALLELALRNSSDLHLSADFNDESWLLEGHNSVPLKRSERDAAKKAKRQAQRHAYSKLTNQDRAALDGLTSIDGKSQNKSKTEIIQARQALLSVSHGQIISHTTFAFWKHLYSASYNDTLWKRSLKKVFPDEAVERSQIAEALENVYKIRNRLAHHEPVHGKRLSGVMKSLDFLRAKLGATATEENTAFMKFSQVHYLRLRMDYEAFMQAWEALTLPGAVAAHP